MSAVAKRFVCQAAVALLSLTLVVAVVVGVTEPGQAQEPALSLVVSEGGTVMMPAPKDAVVLCDGKDTAQWVKQGTDEPIAWKLVDGAMEVNGGNITTKQQFTDFQLHLEFNVPLMPNAQGQARGNSGVYMQGSYEIQVLDSYGLKLGLGDCGAIYGVSVPMVNACKPPGEWQTFDVLFHAPQFDANGNKTANARMSVLQNGIWTQDNVEVPGPTTAAMQRDVTKPGPLMLQDHGCPVRYRNTWLRPLGPAEP